MHSTFHVSKLKQFHRSVEFPQHEITPLEAIVKEAPSDTEYEVEAIIRHRQIGRRREYLVAWTGYPLWEATWEPEENLTRASELLGDYLQRLSNSSNTRRNKQRK